jgi:hypothetical protein
MRAPGSRQLCSLFCAVAPALGCAGTVTGATGTGDAETPATNAVILVERMVNAAEASRAVASARFIRVAGSSTAGALQTIGASLDLPPPGSCATVTSLAAGAGSLAAGALSDGAERALIELADVGSVAIDTGGALARLAPRQVPDVTDVVSGVVYARAADPSLFPAGAPYVVHVTGGADLDPIDAPATAPADPTDVHLVGEDGRGRAELAAGAPIEFDWPSGAPVGDVLYADVRPIGGSGVRCVLTADDDVAGDAGDPSQAPGLARTLVPAASLFDEHGPFTEGTVVIHRVHRETFRARGLDSGEVRFDFARSIAYRR